jgi:hypothetical protein
MYKCFSRFGLVYQEITGNSFGLVYQEITGNSDGIPHCLIVLVAGSA